jgi:lysophospholipase L1-like esterase
MKSILTASFALLLVSFTFVRADLVLKPNDVLTICGDSITQQKLYSVMMEDYFLMCEPVEGLRVCQMGWNGERASGFQARLKSDILPFQPTVVTTCYGMNDGGYRALDQGIGDDYRKNMQLAIDGLMAAGMHAIIVGSPGCVDSTTFQHPSVTPQVYNQTLDALRGIAQDLAQKNGLGFADVHTVMMDVMVKTKAAYGDAYPFAGGPPDGIHPGPNGHLVMAYAFLKALGCDGAIGTITVDLDANSATGTPGQKVVSFQNGTLTLQSTRYPFCFQGDPNKGDVMTASVLRFLPFNDDLNRYVLVVKGIKGSKAKVTWGSQSKEFAAADLAKGVNLAAEFIVNPFCVQFNKVNAAVQTQQNLETTLMQQLFHNLDTLKAMVPNEAASLDQVALGGLQHDKDLFTAAQALVVPVTHTIQIQPEP